MLYLIRIFVVHLRCIENENTSGGMHSCIQLLTWTSASQMFVTSIVPISHALLRNFIDKFMR